MKKAIVILLVLVTALCFSAVACKKQPCKDGEHVFVDGVCSVCGEEEKVERKLMRIRITQEPTKTQYEVGEVFDPAGMVVTASYNDSTTEAVTDYEIDKTGALTANDTTVTVTWRGKSTSFSIVVKSPLVLVKSAVVETADNAIYTIEAEDLDYSNCINSNDNSKGPGIETPSSKVPVTSGGQCIGTLSVPGNTFGFSVESKVDCKATLVMRASATHVNIPVDDLMEFTLNGTVIKCGYTLTWAEGRWWGWEHASFENIDIKKGLNEIVIKCRGQNEPNIDCFYLIVSPTGEEKLPAVIGTTEKTEGSNVTVSSADKKTYRVEAENLDYSRCDFMNHSGEGMQTESIDGGAGTCVNNLSVAGNKFGFSVTNECDEAVPFTFVMRASANWNAMVLDDIIIITLNGERILTGATLAWDGNWNVYDIVKKSGLSLKTGLNEIQIEVKEQALCPNIDYFEIVVEEDAVVPEAEADLTISSSEKKTYRIEAETLDYSKCDFMNHSGEGMQTESIDNGNGTCVNNLSIAGNKFGFTVKNDTADALAFTFAMRASANWDSMVLDDIITITLNGKRILTGATLAWDGNWNVYHIVEKGGLSLISGVNVIEIEVITLCPNVDYFEIIVA